MASLVALEEESRIDFTSLRDLVGISDGNLSLHLQKLEEHGLVIVTKEFVGRRPKTWIESSIDGRNSFAAYVSELASIIGVRPDGTEGEENGKDD